MNLTRRQWLVTGLIGVLSAGFWVVTLWHPPLAVASLIDAVWLVAGLLAGWRFVRDLPESPSTPELPPLLDSPRPPLDHNNLEPPSEEILSAGLPQDHVLGSAIPSEVLEGVEALRQLEAAWEVDVFQQDMTLMSGNAGFIRENVDRAFEIADNLANSAQHAFSLSERVQKGVTVVTNALLESLKQTEVLSEHSARITGILELMSEVSDKIHVLSINASIVSARAGIAGRAFEVVAKEIRSLAKETEHSLGNIVEVIEFLRSSIAKVIKVVRDADAETEQEKNSLIEVAGALQGVILGVEIVKAVSGFAKEKALEQDQLSHGISERQTKQTHEWKVKVAAVRASLEEWIAKE